MPALASRSKRKRRTINEINMVPFIDVMLVLLIIFMVCAPMITTGVVDLPSVGRAKAPPVRVIEVVIADDKRISLRLDGKDAGAVDLARLGQRVKLVQNKAPGAAADVPVVISASKDVRYEVVVKVMDRLQSAGVKRVGLSVQLSGDASG